MIDWTEWDARAAQAVTTASLHFGYVRTQRVNHLLLDFQAYLEEKMLIEDCVLRTTASKEQERLRCTFTFYTVARPTAKLIVAEFRRLARKHEAIGKCSLGPPLVCTAEYPY